MESNLNFLPAFASINRAMKKLITMLRVVVFFAIASEFTLLFYRDLFVITQEHKLLALIWTLPCFHLLITTFLLLITVGGSQFRKISEFSIMKISSIKILSSDGGKIKRFFIAVESDGRHYVLSGIFLCPPSSLVIYRNLAKRLKILSLGNIIMRLRWLVASVIVAIVLNFLILSFQ